jgi:hypothetical protein
MLAASASATRSWLTPGETAPLQFSCECENQDNEQYQSDSAEGIIAPSGTVTPTWKSPDEEKDKDNEEDIAHESRLGQPWKAWQCFFYSPVKDSVSNARNHGEHFSCHPEPRQTARDLTTGVLVGLRRRHVVRTSDRLSAS